MQLSAFKGSVYPMVYACARQCVCAWNVGVVAKTKVGLHGAVFWCKATVPLKMDVPNPDPRMERQTSPEKNIQLAYKFSLPVWQRNVNRWLRLFGRNLKPYFVMVGSALNSILPHMTYSAGLFKLKLQTLEMRRIITDLTVCHKLLNGLTETDYKFALSLSRISQTRGNKQESFSKYAWCFFPLQ